MHNFYLLVQLLELYNTCEDYKKAVSPSSALNFINDRTFSDGDNLPKVFDEIDEPIEGELVTFFRSNILSDC